MHTYQFTYRPMPAQIAADGLQFDLFNANGINRAPAYLHPLDETVVAKESARVYWMFRTAENPAHEAVVIIGAKGIEIDKPLFKFYSNIDELGPFCTNWINYDLMCGQLIGLLRHLKTLDHKFLLECGDGTSVWVGSIRSCPDQTNNSAVKHGIRNK